MKHPDRLLGDASACAGDRQIDAVTHKDHVRAQNVIHVEDHGLRYAVRLSIITIGGLILEAADWKAG